MSGEVLFDDTDPGSSLGVDTGDRELGMQQYNGGPMQADAVFEATKKQKEKGKAWWWQCVSVVLVAVSATQVLCRLQCKLCKQLLSPSNPPDVCKSHLKQKNCSGYRKGVQEGLIQTEEQQKGQQQQQGQQQEASTSNKRRATGQQLRIDDMKGQRELAKEHLAQFFFKNSIPLHLIDDPDLKAAFSLLGCDLPTRKTLSTSMLDRAYANCCVQMQRLIDASRRVLDMFGLCTDTWARRAAARGAPLCNAMVLLPNRGAVFGDIVNLQGEVKSAEFIRDLHIDLIEDTIPGGMEKCLGVIMDNTKANLSAMRMLKGMYPQKLFLGCNAHATDLFLKDLGKRTRKSGLEGPCPGTAAVIEKAIMASNVVNGSSSVRAALAKVQGDAGRPVKSVAVHCPTRFATTMFIARDLLAIESDIRALVRDEETWEDVSRSCTHAEDFKALTLNTFFTDLGHVLALGQAFCDTIHRMEADVPSLSQVMDAWDDLMKHTRSWTQRRGVNTALAKGVMHRLKGRVKIHYSPAWAAATLIDPIHFEAVVDEQMMMPFEKLSALSPACYEDNSKDDDADWKSGSSSQAPQGRGRVRKWDRLKDAEDCILEMAGEDGPAVKEELRRAKLQPFAQSLSELAAGLLPQEDGSLPPIVERVNFWRMWAKKDFPVLAGVAVRLLCMHSTACASERNWSAWGQLYTKHRSRLALERARKLIYVRCNSKQFTEDDLEASMQLLEENE